MNAVATLMRDCGVAVSMAYGTNESSAYDEAARAAFISHFGYDAKIVDKSYSYTTYGYGLPSTTTVTL